MACCCSSIVKRHRQLFHSDYMSESLCRQTDCLTVCDPAESGLARARKVAYTDIEIRVSYKTCRRQHGRRTLTRRLACIAISPTRVASLCKQRMRNIIYGSCWSLFYTQEQAFVTGSRRNSCMTAVLIFFAESDIYCARVCVCMRACVRACVRARARVCVCV